MNLKSLQEKFKENRNLKELIPKAVSLILLGMAFVITMYYVKENVWLTLTSDDASELVLGRLLADEGGILSKNWYYSTELRVLNTNIFYKLFFMLTDNWRHVRLLAYMCMYALLILAYLIMSKAYRINRYAGLFGIFLMIPLSGEYYTFVLKGAYYLPHITISFVILALSQFFVKKKGKLKIIILGFSVVLSLLAGLGGARQILILYIPLLLAALIGIIIRKSSDEKKYIVFAVVNFIAGIIGYEINTKILSQQYSFQVWDFSFTGISFSRIEQVLNGILYVFGFTTASVFSFSILKNIIAVSWVILTIYAIIYAIKNAKRVIFEYFSISIFTAVACSIFLLLYFFSNIHFENRYWLLITVLSFPLAAAFFNELEAKRTFINATVIIFVMFCCICGIQYYKENWKTDSTYELRQISEIAQNQGYATGYASFWNANVLTELSNGKIDMYDWINTGDSSNQNMRDLKDVDQTFTWLQLKRHDYERPKGKVFILFSKQEAQTNNWKWNLKEEDLIYYSDSYVAYGYENYNVMVTTLYEEYEVSFGNNDNILNGSDVGNHRELYTGGKSCGPFITLPAGEYSVVIKGEGLDRTIFDCCYNAGQSKIEMNVSEICSEEIKYEFTLNEKTTGIEFLIENISEETVIVNKIHVENIK